MVTKQRTKWRLISCGFSNPINSSIQTWEWRLVMIFGCSAHLCSKTNRWNKSKKFLSRKTSTLARRRCRKPSSKEPLFPPERKQLSTSIAISNSNQNKQHVSVSLAPSSHTSTYLLFSLCFHFREANFFLSRSCLKSFAQCATPFGRHFRLCLSLRRWNVKNSQRIPAQQWKSTRLISPALTIP